MKAAFLGVAAGLVLASAYSLPSLAQQYHDHDDDSGSYYGDRYHMRYRGDQDDHSGRQYDERLDRQDDRERSVGPMMPRGGGARFQFSRGDAHIDIRCPQNETLQNCVQAAIQLIDKVHGLGTGLSQTNQPPTPTQDSR